MTAGRDGRPPRRAFLGALDEAYARSLREVGPAAAATFRVLGRLPSDDVPSPVVADLTGRPAGEVDLLLARLCQVGLLVAVGGDRYRCHRLLRGYARTLGPVDLDRRERLGSAAGISVPHVTTWTGLGPSGGEQGDSVG